jgi:hypothetical protein
MNNVLFCFYTTVGHRSVVVLVFLNDYYESNLRGYNSLQFRILRYSALKIFLDRPPSSPRSTSHPLNRNFQIYLIMVVIELVKIGSLQVTVQKNLFDAILWMPGGCLGILLIIYPKRPLPQPPAGTATFFQKAPY